MKVTICVGSSCHLKGSQQVIEQLQAMVAKYELEDKILLSGAFCMGTCMDGVCVTIDDKVFAVKPEDAKSFFKEEILTRL